MKIELQKRNSEATKSLSVRFFFWFLILEETYCGFAVLGVFLRDFSVSNRPLWPPPFNLLALKTKDGLSGLLHLSFRLQRESEYCLKCVVASKSVASTGLVALSRSPVSHLRSIHFFV